LGGDTQILLKSKPIKVQLQIANPFEFCENSIKDIFINNTQPVSYAVNAVSPYSRNSYNINNS
jgi:hypothetical protein